MVSTANQLDLFTPLQALVGEGKLTANGLLLDDPDLPYDTYEAIGRFLGKLGDAVRFAIGDWLLHGERLYGEKVYQAAVATGLSESTCMDYQRVAAKVARSRRRMDELAWSHHRTVAALAPPEQRAWLDRSIENGWSAALLREQISGGSRPRTATILPPAPSVLTRDEAGAAAKVLTETGHQETKVATKLRAAANGAALVSEQPGKQPCETCGGSGYV